MKGITEHWFAIGLEQRVVAVDAMCTVGPSNGVGLFVLWGSDSQLIDDAMECRIEKKKQVRSNANLFVRVGTLLDFTGPNSVRHRLGCAGETASLRGRR